MQKEKEIRKPVQSASTTENIEDGFDRVFQYYGTDLSAFLRDAYKQFATKCEEPDNSKRYY
jgi:hypothetical protein